MTPLPVGAQPAGNQQFAFGTEVLRWLLKSNANLKPVDRPASLKDAEHTILIVLGDLSWLENNVPGGVEDFVQKGGALLAASDLSSGKSLENLAGVQISSYQIELPLDKNARNCHREQRDSPFVDETQASFPDGSENPFSGLKLRVATNISKRLLTDGALPKGIVPLARFPKGVFWFQPIFGSGEQTKGISLLLREEALFAVGGSRGEGRLLVLGDHSVFINQMMLDDQCGNLEFTVQCLEWLKSNGQRDRAMLVEDGRIHSNFDVTLKRIPPIPPLKVLEELFNHRDEIIEEMQTKLAESERKKTLDAALLKSLDGRPQVAANRLRRYSLWGFGGFLVVAILYRLSNNGRHFPDRRLPLLGPVVAKQRPAAGAAEVRPRAQIEAGNLWESARELAQESLGQNPLEDTPPPKPAVVARGWWVRRQSRRRLERLWEIAYGSDTVPIPPGQWEQFLSDLQEFEQDVADGRVKLPAA
jgi:hypothetical protein